MLTIWIWSFLFPTVYSGILTLCVPITSVQLDLLHEASSVENNFLHEIQRYKAQGVFSSKISSFIDINVRVSYNIIIFYFKLTLQALFWIDYIYTDFFYACKHVRYKVWYFNAFIHYYLLNIIHVFSSWLFLHNLRYNFNFLFKLDIMVL
jgi:hypothetical protein